MISTIGSMTGISYDSFLTTQGNAKLFVPVQPNLVIYSQLEHVVGIPTDTNQSGVSVNKIQLLNTLIDQLVSMKQKPDTMPQSEVMNDKQVDSLIESYQSQIKSAMQLAQANPYATGGVTVPQGGTVLSFTI